YQAEIELFGRDREQAPYRVGANVRFSFTPLQRQAAQMTDAALRHASRSWVRYHFDYGSEAMGVTGENIVRAVHRLEVVAEMSRHFSIGVIGQYDSLKYRWGENLEYANTKMAGILVELRTEKDFRMSAAVGVGRREALSTYRYTPNDERDLVFVRHEMDILRPQSAFSQVISVQIAEEGRYHDGWILLDIVNAVEFILLPELSLIPRITARRWFRTYGITETEFTCALRCYPVPRFSVELAPMYVMHKQGWYRDPENTLAIEGRVRVRF
ncbi:MAG: hypothetical protein RRA94_13245, partial [Bacteroidota bacterium]|nr:hypothetical protein [Bacteroidota bacterium]